MRTPARAARMSNWYLLTRTYLYIIKRLHREQIERFAPRLKGLIVDIGCGLRPYRDLFTAAGSYVGLDLVHERRPDVVADVNAIPVTSGAADSIVCLEVLEHVPDADTAMSEIRRITKAGGQLLVSVPMSWNLHYEPRDFRRYTSYGLRALLEQHGFDVLEMARIGGLFSLIGSRLVDGVASELYRRLSFIPRRLRHALVLFYTIPVSVLFFAISRAADRFEHSDAIAWIALAKLRHE